MTLSSAFSEFLSNIKVDNFDVIGMRYKEITKKLNKTFRDTDSETSNSLQVGSYGRYTGIKGISDLDMLYIMPSSKWADYYNDPAKLLRETRDALKDRYPNSDIHYDRLVVVINFTDFKFEVQPVFEVKDENGKHLGYKYPDTKNECYKITKPKQEQEAMITFKQKHGGHHRHLCKMMRAWKNKVGLAMGGLLLDTLTYNFLLENDCYDNCSYSDYGSMVKDFLEYLKDQPKQDHYQALGSNQDVKVKNAFQSKAKTSYELAEKACSETNEHERNNLWRDVFGCSFPKAEVKPQTYSYEYTASEEFIGNYYTVNITNSVSINCKIERDGFRPKILSEVLSKKEWIPKQYSLLFYIENTDVTGPYEVKWKIRNIGPEAKRRNCLRGQIESSNKSNNQRKEHSNFFGRHYVECYIIKNNRVIARDRIDVPIE